MLHTAFAHEREYSQSYSLKCENIRKRTQYFRLRKSIPFADLSPRNPRHLNMDEIILQENNVINGYAIPTND